MNPFNMLFLWLLGLYRQTLGRILTAELQVGAAMAREEFYAQAELQAAEFERQGRPELAAAIRTECQRQRAEDSASACTPAVAPDSATSAPPQPLPSVPTDGKLQPSKSAKLSKFTRAIWQCS